MTKCRTSLGAGVLGLALALAYAPALHAQDPPAAATQAPAYVVGEALPPVLEGSTLAPMTLEQAVARALQSNLDIQSARLAPEIQNYALRAAYAAFTPTINATFGRTSQTNQSTSQLDGGARTRNDRYNFNTSLSKTMPWYGGRLSANFNNSRTETNNAFATRNPSYNSTLSFNYTQPLLSGFTIDAQRASIETAEIQTDITDLQVQSQIENITYQVREAYWQVRAAIEQIEIQRRNLAEAEQLLEQNRISVRLGRAVELQLAQTEAQVASARQALLNAEIQWRNAEFAFKRLLISGPSDPLLAQTINPVDLPRIVDTEVDIQSAIDIAMRERMDLRQQRQQIDIAEVNLAVNETNSLPDLSVTAAYSLQGVGGNRYTRSELGGTPVLTQPGGYMDGIESIGNFDTPTWSLTLNASYPVGTNPAKANLERARLQLRQTELSLRSQELAIITEVTTAGLAVRNSYLQLEAARTNREAAERAAESARLRQEVGVATNFEVLTAQNSLTAARLSELQAIINHVNAVAEFERVQHVGG